MLIPLASTLVALFKKPKIPKNNIIGLTRAEVDSSKNLRRGDEYVER
jgi:hypothetical protein